MIQISHYTDVTMSAMVPQITGATIVCSTVSSNVDQRNIKPPRQWNILKWCQLNALQALHVVHLLTRLSCVPLSMNTQSSVPAIRIISQQMLKTLVTEMHLNIAHWTSQPHLITVASYWARWRLDSLLNCLFRRRSKKTSKLRLTGIYEGNPPVTGGFPPNKGQVTQKMFPFNDVIISHGPIRS